MRRGCSLLLLSLFIPTLSPAGDWPHTEDATGGWGGRRSWLADHGVTLDLDYTAEVMGRLTGEAAAGYRGNLDLMLTLDSEKLGLWPGAVLFVYGQNGHGPGISEELGAPMPVSSLEAPDFTQLSELWLLQSFGEVLKLRIGKQDANRDFAGPRFAGNFVSSSYGAPPSVPMATFPTPAAGVAAFLIPTRWLEFRGGVYEAAPELEAIGGGGFDQGVLALGELLVRHDLRGRPAGIHTLGVWVSSAGERAGVFGVADLQLVLARPRSVQLFVRGGWSPESEGVARVYLGGGATLHGFAGADNTLGLGAGHASFPGTGDETFLELFFKWRPLDWLSFELDVQPYFIGDAADVVALLRSKIKL